MASETFFRAGVMGWPVSHSLSPRLHGYWLRLHHVSGVYGAIPVEPQQLASALGLLQIHGYRGVNLTIPHKEQALKFVDVVEPLARRIGAVNTVVVSEDGTLEGRNTDAFGFIETLRSSGYLFDEDNKRGIVVLGAGGAARAALVGLLDQGVKDIRLVNRTRERAEALAEEIDPDAISVFDWRDSAAFKGAGLLVNATSLGMVGQPPLDYSLDGLAQSAFVMDMVYAPLITPLLAEAARRGYRAIDGLGMLLHQARPAFAAFFGIDPKVTPELRAYVLEGRG
ncbi:MAG: shikimate dehydrogenase [Bdellovibrionales bacterium]